VKLIEEKFMTEFEHKLALAQRAVGQGKLSRRDFMQFTMAAGVTLAASQAMFAGAAQTRSTRQPGRTALPSISESRSLRHL